jgi:DNA polymerase III alpha subunit (gram-positive type)
MFSIENDKLRVPLSSLKGVGETVSADIQNLLHNSLKDLGLVRKQELAQVTRKKKNVSSDGKQDDFKGFAGETW